MNEKLFKSLVESMDTWEDYIIPEKLNKLSFEDLARESLPLPKGLLDRMKAISEKAEESIFKDACILNKFPEDVLEGKPLFISCPCRKCTPYVM